MMGEKGRHFAAHSAVSLEALVPADHFYRTLERTLDLAFVRDLVRDRYAARGRPSIDPIVFFKLQLVLFFEGLRSERQLLRVVADRLSVRWYLGYDLGEALPDHSSLTKIRERYGVEIFRRFFEAVVEQCRAAGLVWGDELYIDATQVDANAALDSLRPRFAVDTHLRDLFKPGDPAVQEECAAEVGDAAGPTPLPAADPATVSDLAAANAERHDWLAGLGRPQRDVTHGSYQRRADLEMSTTDPDATYKRRDGGKPHLGYQAHALVDGGKARIILQTLVAPAEVTENQPMLDLLWRARFRWRLRPRQVTGDTKYGTVENIKAIEDAGIRAYVPLADNDKRTPLFSKRDFTYDPERDAYTCPHGAVLPFTSVSTKDQLKVYYADRATCNACPLKARCTTTDQGRRVSRHVDEAYVERVRAYHGTAPYERARRKRQVWVEPLFAEAKDWHGLRRFRLRGLEKVNAEALVTTTGQNLKRLLSQGGWGRRPWPGGAPGLRVAVGMPSPTIPI
ncbi:MAG: IS1182 family transposase [Chloroflexota bacterium]|nr:IS1182 family transposase [Chloroflexota bacterium]